MEGILARYRRTPRRVIKTIPEVVEVHWKIPDFFLYDFKYRNCISSPDFKFADIDWYLEVYPRGMDYRGWMSAFLHYRGDMFEEDEGKEIKTDSITISIETKNEGFIKEKTQTKRTFIEGWHPSKASSWGWSKFLGLANSRYRQAKESEDEVTFTCRVERRAPIPKEDASDPQKVVSRRMILIEVEDYERDQWDYMLNSCEMTPKTELVKNIVRNNTKEDVTINVQGKEFPAHRAVLAAASPVFRAMYEHDTSEAESGILTIPDCDPEIFHCFLSFIYFGRLELTSFTRAYHLYIISDKYDEQQIKSFCAEYMSESLTPENICEVVILADLHSDNMLMYSAQTFFDENHEKILLTSEWKDNMVKNYPELVKKLASATEESF